MTGLSRKFRWSKVTGMAINLADIVTITATMDVAITRSIVVDPYASEFSPKVESSLRVIAYINGYGAPSSEEDSGTFGPLVCRLNEVDISSTLFSAVSAAQMLVEDPSKPVGSKVRRFTEEAKALFLAIAESQAMDELGPAPEDVNSRAGKVYATKFETLVREYTDSVRKQTAASFQRMRDTHREILTVKEAIDRVKAIALNPASSPTVEALISDECDEDGVDVVEENHVLSVEALEQRLQDYIMLMDELVKETQERLTTGSNELNLRVDQENITYVRGMGAGLGVAIEGNTSQSSSFKQALSAFVDKVHEEGQAAVNLLNG